MADEASGPGVSEDPWQTLRAVTPARIALGRSGISQPTRHHLAFQLAHARARDAVHSELDITRLRQDLVEADLESLVLSSAATDRATYLRRPDLGRRLDQASADLLAARGRAASDVVFVIADGLSALAVQRHAAPLLRRILAQIDRDGWRSGPLCIVRQGRVAIGDDIGQRLGAALAVILIGERPGLSSPDSLGVYLTWNPRLDATDAERNCISNIHAAGLTYDEAAQTLLYLMTEARRRRLSGVLLKDETQVTGGTTPALDEASDGQPT
ncbi:MAG TPA: ethanolamine ammonia-lyase subunit EutC [Thermomicrobiales bacterium]|nr:ethanolamine ammonia-lyase subunit EutC [Thermomicrobiales bacterium]